MESVRPEIMEALGDIFLGFGFIAIVSLLITRGVIISISISRSFLKSRMSSYRPRMVTRLEGWVAK